MTDFMYLDQDFLRREKPVDMDNLPQKCCAKCTEWIESDGMKIKLPGYPLALIPPTKKITGCGLCCKNSNYEWDAFAWADDCCGDFELDENEEDAQPSESDIGVAVQESCGKDMRKKPGGPNILGNWCTGE